MAVSCSISMKHKKFSFKGVQETFTRQIIFWVVTGKRSNQQIGNLFFILSLRSFQILSLRSFLQQNGNFGIRFYFRCKESILVALKVSTTISTTNYSIFVGYEYNLAFDIIQFDNFSFIHQSLSGLFFFRSK